MYNLFKKLGAKLDIREADSNYKCTFMWKVILASLTLLGLVALEIAMLYSGFTSGFTFTNASFLQIVFYANVLCVSLILVKFAFAYEKVMLVSFFAMATLMIVTFLFANYELITGTIDKDIEPVVLLVDVIMLMLALPLLNSHFRITQRILDKFCTKI